MEDYIQQFIRYLHEEKHKSRNTELSYARDLKKLNIFCREKHVDSVKDITRKCWNSTLRICRKMG